jgi:RNA polymerase sigma factor (sigma-70 family)
LGYFSCTTRIKKNQMDNFELEPEEKILEAVRRKESKALQQLYKNNYQSVLHLVLNNSGNEDEARDIYQEAIIVLYENLQNPSFRLTCKIQTYIYSVSRKLWLKQLTAKGRNALKVEDVESFLPVEEPDTDDREEKFISMKIAMDGLGEPCKTLIEDFYLHRLSMQDISEKFGYTNSDNAKNQKYKCLARLKKLFFEKYQKRG